MWANKFGLGLAYDHRWIFEVSMIDKMFLTSPSVSNINIEKTTLPEITTSFTNDFYQYKDATFSYLLSGSVFLPRNSGNVNSKLGYGAGGTLETKLQNQAFQIGFDLNFLKATGNSTEEQNIYWKYIWFTY